MTLFESELARPEILLDQLRGVESKLFGEVDGTMIALLHSLGSLDEIQLKIGRALKKLEDTLSEKNDSTETVYMIQELERYALLLQKTTSDNLIEAFQEQNMTNGTYTIDSQYIFLGLVRKGYFPDTPREITTSNISLEKLIKRCEEFHPNNLSAIRWDVNYIRYIETYKRLLDNCRIAAKNISQTERDEAEMSQPKHHKRVEEHSLLQQKALNLYNVDIDEKKIEFLELVRLITKDRISYMNKQRTEDKIEDRISSTEHTLLRKALRELYNKTDFETFNQLFKQYLYYYSYRFHRYPLGNEISGDAYKKVRDESLKSLVENTVKVGAGLGIAKILGLKKILPAKMTKFDFMKLLKVSFDTMYKTGMSLGEGEKYDFSYRLANALIPKKDLLQVIGDEFNITITGKIGQAILLADQIGSGVPGKDIRFDGGLLNYTENQLARMKNILMYQGGLEEDLADELINKGYIGRVDVEYLYDLYRKESNGIQEDRSKFSIVA